MVTLINQVVIVYYPCSFAANKNNSTCSQQQMEAQLGTSSAPSVHEVKFQLHFCVFMDISSSWEVPASPHPLELAVSMELN